MRYFKTLSSVLAMLIIFGSCLSSQAQLASFRKASYTSSQGDTLPYQILYPKDYDPTKKYPLILFLHGSGERGNDNEKQLMHGSSLFTHEKNQNDFPAIVVFPQCPSESYWASAVIDRSKRPYEIKFDYTAKPS